MTDWLFLSFLLWLCNSFPRILCSEFIVVDELQRIQMNWIKSYGVQKLILKFQPNRTSGSQVTVDQSWFWNFSPIGPADHKLRCTKVNFEISARSDQRIISYGVPKLISKFQPDPSNGSQDTLFQSLFQNLKSIRPTVHKLYYLFFHLLASEDGIKLRIKKLHNN